MIVEKVLAIIFSLLILAQADMLRRLVGTWIFPACLFGLFWFLYTFIPLVALLTVPVEPYAVGYILLCCLAFSVTSIGFDWRQAFEINQSRVQRPDYGSRFIRRMFYGTTAVVILCLIINTIIQGFSLYDIIFNLLETASQYIARRYADDLPSNVFGQLSIVLAYPAAILGGLVYASRSGGKEGAVVILLSALPSVLMMLIQGAKGALFLVIFFFWAGVLINKLNNGETAILGKGALKKIAISGALLFPIVTLSFLARGLYESDDWDYITTQLIRYFASYSSAHLYAFSDWFSHLIHGPSVMSYADDFGANGFYTFMALFFLFGSDKVVPAGVYDEYFYYGDILQSNIYTIFRGLIIDFGMGGAVVFMLGLGLILHTVFFCQLTSKRPFISVSVFAHSIGFFYTSFIISLLIWNSIYASFAVLSLIFFINNKISQKNGNRAK